MPVPLSFFDRIAELKEKQKDSELKELDIDTLYGEDLAVEAENDDDDDDDDEMKHHRTHQPRHPRNHQHHPHRHRHNHHHQKVNPALKDSENKPQSYFHEQFKEILLALWVNNFDFTTTAKHLNITAQELTQNIIFLSRLGYSFGLPAALGISTDIETPNPPDFIHHDQALQISLEKIMQLHKSRGITHPGANRFRKRDELIRKLFLAVEQLLGTFVSKPLPLEPEVDEDHDTGASEVGDGKGTDNSDQGEGDDAVGCGGEADGKAEGGADTEVDGEAEVDNEAEVDGEGRVGVW
eukprot:TRINITY_DN16648_c0_g1_i1.p1 TRINITY_DN16648_c0_g1~~TRINITY_DN16648_c0_g1_i1.p1  ORF type:complete len:338 (+),score=96.91 TRINITY_DN16648_c0_g1_i1:132-1016(+)